MSTRQLTAVGATLVLGVLVLGGLAISGVRYIPVRTFALGSPNVQQVAVVRRGRQVCEGGVISQGSFDEVGLFGSSVVAAGPIDVTVAEDHGGRVLARGTQYPVTTPTEFFVLLDRPVAESAPLTICVRGRSRGGMSLLGSAAVDPVTTMTGSHHQLEFSLVLRRRTGQSLLSSLPRAFSRASLWRPQWVGPWTYWILLALLVGAVPLLAFAVVSATGEDDDPGSDDQAASSAEAARQ